MRRTPRDRRRRALAQSDATIAARLAGAHGRRRAHRLLLATGVDPGAGPADVAPEAWAALSR
jgi:hypothetical protein